MIKNMKWFNTITLLSLCIMIALPFSKSMLEICFTVALISWILGKRMSLKPVSTPLNLPLYLFALLGFLSVLISPAISLSLKAFFSKLLKVIVFYFIIVETVDSRKKVKAILTAFLFSAIIIVADVIFQLIKSTDFLRQYSMIGDRVTGPFQNPNNLAAWLTIAVPLSLCLLFFGSKNLSKKIKTLLFFLAVILTVCLVLTYSRGAWIAVILSLILTGIIKSKKMAMITILAVTLLFFFSTKSIKERTISIVTGPKADRTILWKESVMIIKDFPLLGCGLNTYSTIAPKYKIGEYGGSYPHNSYLQMAAETGLLGLGAFLWIIVTLFKTSLASLKKIDDKFYSAILIGLLAGLLAFLAHSFVDTHFYSLGLRYLMWLVIGLIVAVQRIALKEDSKPGVCDV